MYDYEANKDKLIDSRGVRLTTGLFEELARDDTSVKPVFKLSDWRKKYVEIADPTGYEAALELIGDWEHWQLITQSPAFALHLARWNLEVEAKLKSQGIRQLMKQSKLPTGTAAAKWLAEAGFVPGRDKRRKQDKKDDEQTTKEARTSVAADAARLGLVAVK